jgi:C1A family cysteine protease
MKSTAVWGYARILSTGGLAAAAATLLSSGALSAPLTQEELDALVADAGELSGPVAHWDVKGLKAVANQAGFTFTVGDNWVTRFLAEGGNIRDITGLVRPKNWAEKETFVDLEADDDLPAAFDWRGLVDGGMQPIKNQGSCGSCWAFSVTAVIESLMRIKDPAAPVADLAEQTLVSSCSSSGSCSGGYFSAFNYTKNPGLPDEAQDPYKAYNTRCKQGLRPVQKIVRWAYIGNRDGRGATTDQLKTAIKTYGPISVDVNGSFGSYSGGIYNNCNSSGTNHMVTLEGWDDGDGTNGHWIMRNSWGANWGEQGYMKIVYKGRSGRNCNGIGNVAAFAVLEEPTPPTP